MRLGLFCSFPNPTGDFAAAIANQIALVRRAEALGFASAWSVEHHFAPDSAAASIAVLMGAMAAATSRIRLGAAAVLLPFHDPLMIAEDIATLDCLSGGRIDFGVARGGPFADQNRHFAVDTGASRERMLDALTLVKRLLGEDEVTHRGLCFQVERVRLTPRPVQRPIPIWIATGSPDALEMAAAGGHGIMAGPPHAFERIEAQIAGYRAHAPGGDPQLVMARFFHAAATREEALAAVTAPLTAFLAKMLPRFESLWPEIARGLDLDALIARSVIGSHDEVREKIALIERRFSPHTLALAPIAPGLEAQTRALASLAERGLLPAAG